MVKLRWHSFDYGVLCYLLFFSFYNAAKVVIYQSLHQCYLAGFLTRVWNFPAFKTRLKFRFHVQHFGTFLFGFSVLCFKMEFNPLQNLLNTGFTIIEIGLFYDGEQLESKICRFLTFWQDHFKREFLLCT
mgnify:CR=1 FL=1